MENSFLFCWQNSLDSLHFLSTTQSYYDVNCSVVVAFFQMLRESEWPNKFKWVCVEHFKCGGVAKYHSRTLILCRKLQKSEIKTRPKTIPVALHLIYEKILYMSKSKSNTMNSSIWLRAESRYTKVIYIAPFRSIKNLIGSLVVLVLVAPPAYP